MYDWLIQKERKYTVLFTLVLSTLLQKNLYGKNIKILKENNQLFDFCSHLEFTSYWYSKFLSLS